MLAILCLFVGLFFFKFVERMRSVRKVIYTVVVLTCFIIFVCVCVCVGFVMCGCMCGFCNVWVFW